MDLNLKITKLALRDKPSTWPEVKEQREAVVRDAIATVDNAVKECTTLFEQALKVVTNLQEDPTLQRLETEAQELQQRYDEVKVTMRTIALTQRLEKLQEAKMLKEQVDAV